MAEEDKGFGSLIEELEELEEKILSGEKRTTEKKPPKPVKRNKSEIRYRISTPEDERLILRFESLCRDTQRVPRAVLFNLIDKWVRTEGTTLYGAGEIARMLERD